MFTGITREICEQAWQIVEPAIAKAAADAGIPLIATDDPIELPLASALGQIHGETREPLPFAQGCGR